MAVFNDRYYFFANWKMYLDLEASNSLASALASESKKISPAVKTVVFPGALSFYGVSQILKEAGIESGAQNIYWIDKGGYTGELSAEMYKAAGAHYALVGHSERRHLFGESKQDVRKKMEAALAAGLTPVLCVGETEEEHKRAETENVLETQLRSAFDQLSWPQERELIVAYEPVWAIGTGNACEAEEAERVQALMMRWLSALVKKSAPVLLYGGSVRANNVADYLKREHIHGVLVGGASAKLDSWLEIIKQV